MLLQKHQNEFNQRETLIEFSMAVFSGRDKTQFVANVQYVSGQTRVDEFDFLTEAFDGGCQTCAEYPQMAGKLHLYPVAS